MSVSLAYSNHNVSHEYLEFEVEAARPRCSPKRTWRKVVQRDCQACKLNREDAVDHIRRQKLIKDD